MTTIRPYGVDDFPRFAAVRTAVQVAKPDAWMPEPDSDKNPEFRLLAEVGDVPVGYGWMDWWTEDDGTRLLLLLGYIDPVWRGRGIGRELLAAQERAAAPFVASLEGTAPVMFGANADEDQPDARRLVERAGFAVAFTYVEMELDLVHTPPVLSVLPPGFVERQVVAGDHERIHAAIEESFAGAAGHVRRSFESFRRDVKDDSDLWFVAWDGDEVAGVVINARLGDKTVSTEWVAVREPWRRRGLAAGMVGIGLCRSVSAGLSMAKVATISENVNRTIGLYERFGYRVTRRMPRYRKPAR